MKWINQMLTLALPGCLALLLTACQSQGVPATSPSPVQEPAVSIPLNEEAQAIPVPSFLDEEQQTLYRQAYSLYSHMFGGETTAIEYPELEPEQAVDWSEYETVELDGMLYYVSRGPFADWADFDAAVHAVFTDTFWAEKNAYSIYREWEGKLCFLDASRGAGYYYNEYFPDEFVLESQTDSEIDFTLIGHYSPVWPREGESYEERDARLAREYDYTLEFPIRMVLTEEGWRFEEFHAALADEAEQ